MCTEPDNTVVKRRVHLLDHTEFYQEVMAGTQEAEVLLSKRVQEMVLDGEEPPALYICRHGEDTDDYSTVSQIPVIDLSLVSPSAASTDISIEELQKLRSALSSWGCFQVRYHITFTHL